MQTLDSEKLSHTCETVVADNRPVQNSLSGAGVGFNSSTAGSAQLQLSSGDPGTGHLCGMSTSLCWSLDTVSAGKHTLLHNALRYTCKLPSHNRIAVSCEQSPRDAHTHCMCCGKACRKTRTDPTKLHMEVCSHAATCPTTQMQRIKLPSLLHPFYSKHVQPHMLTAAWRRQICTTAKQRVACEQRRVKALAQLRPDKN